MHNFPQCISVSEHEAIIDREKLTLERCMASLELSRSQERKAQEALKIAREALDSIGEYFDCQYCEMNSHEMVCDSHLTSRMKIAKQAQKQIDEILNKKENEK